MLEPPVTEGPGHLQHSHHSTLPAAREEGGRGGGEWEGVGESERRRWRGETKEGREEGGRGKGEEGVREGEREKRQGEGGEREGEGGRESERGT